MANQINAGVDPVGIKNAALTQINPATEDTLALINANTQGLSNNTLPTTPVIYNIDLVAANVEYSQVLPSSTKSFTVKARGVAPIRIAFVSGGSNLNFVTVPGGMNYFEQLVRLTGRTLFISSSNAGEVAEIIAYS